MQFLHLNGSQLYPTLSHPRFFPGMSWAEIVELLHTALFHIIDNDVLPALRRIVFDQIDFSFVNFLGRSDSSRDRVSDQVYDVLVELLKRPATRRALTGPFTAVHFRLAAPYIDRVYARKAYIHFELTKVQRLRLSKDEVKSMVDATLLLKPAVHPARSESDSHAAGGFIAAGFAERALSHLESRLSLLPEQAVRSAVHANVSFHEHRFVEATSRLAAVFAGRGRNYRPGVRVDRGADTPDKSWLSIARRNHKFYGLDGKMLDELYSIAAETAW
ncbi:MAG: hypothetical protein ACLFPO_02555 [Spirochaetaceae bacterium]